MKKVRIAGAINLILSVVLLFAFFTLFNEIYSFIAGGSTLIVWPEFMSNIIDIIKDIVIYPIGWVMTTLTNVMPALGEGDAENLVLMILVVVPMIYFVFRFFTSLMVLVKGSNRSKKKNGWYNFNSLLLTAGTFASGLYIFNLIKEMSSESVIANSTAAYISLFVVAGLTLITFIMVMLGRRQRN